MNLILLLFPPDSSAAYKINTSRAEITHKFCFGFCSKRTCKLWRNYGIKGMYCLLNFFFLSVPATWLRLFSNNFMISGIRLYYLSELMLCLDNWPFFFVVLLVVNAWHS
jgi:hypothetical protein